MSVRSLPRGLVAALIVSLAVHLAAFGLPWLGGQGGQTRPASVSTLVARLIEVPDSREPGPSSAIPAAAEPEPITPAITAAVPAAAPLPTVPPWTPPPTPPVPARAVGTAPAVAASSSADRGTNPARPAEPTPAARSGGEGQTTGLDRGPRPLDDIDPAFPVAAGTRGGTVTLRLVISDKGEVESIAVVHAVPPGLFDEAALAAFGKARFSPGLRGGVPVRSEVMYEVEFAASGKGTESSGRTY